MADIDPNTGTPKTVTLGDVLSNIALAPSQVSEFLRTLAYMHLGGAHDDMARTLLQHANDVANPATYGADQPSNPQAQWGQPPAPGSPVLNQPPNPTGPVGASGVPVGTSATTPVPASGAGQGQSALPSMGTANEPAWMADARAAGWQAERPNDSAPVEPAWQAEARAAGWRNAGDDGAKTPVPSPFATRAPARHFDDAKGQWVDNATGQPVDVGGASASTPPQPKAPGQ